MRWFVSLLLVVVGILSAHAAHPEAAPKPRPLLLLAPFNGEKLVVRAVTATTQGNLLSVETDAGARAGWERTALVATLPWYTDAELTAGSVNFAGLLAMYDEAARQHPPFQPGLSVETTRVRAAMAAIDGEHAAKIAAVLSDEYDPAHAYTADALRERIHAAEETIGFAAGQRTQIEQAVARLREHLSNLEAGKTYYDHGWRTPDELGKLKAQADEDAKVATLLPGLQVVVDAQIISANRVNAVLHTVVIVYGILALLGVVLIFRQDRKTGIALIVLPAAGAAVYAYLLFATDVPFWPSPPAEPVVKQGSTVMARLLYNATRARDEIPAGARYLPVGGADVNGFLAAHVKRQGEPANGAINFQRLAIQSRSGGVSFYETAEWRGRTLLIRHDLDIVIRAGKPVVTHDEVTIGNAPLREPVQGWFRTEFAAQLARFFGQHDFLATYSAFPFSEHGTALVLDAPTPAPVAATSPTPTASPGATATPTETMPLATPPPEPAVAAATPEPGSVAVELPPLDANGTTPAPDNTFYIYAIWDGINSAPDDEIEAQMDRLHDQFGKGNRFHRVGFAFILSGNEAKLRSICNLARRKNLAIGVILGAQTHSGAGKAEVQQDFRAVQWRLSGAEWRGGEGGRDSMLPTPSRYCKLVRDALAKGQRQRCEMLRRVMQSCPGVITCINGTIEEELADGGQTSDDKLADYSPFAVTEFRDWLRHTGEYDADGGRYAGQGAPEGITGPSVFIKGKNRSPFYAASDPGTTVGGNSFNGRFSTHFKTWTLKYWDLTAFPGKITDDGFNPTPDAGAGFTEDGFDAPRKRDASRWWQTWSWDYQDRDKRYPPGGKPENAAFGFRQVMVHHFVEDMFQVAVDAKLPVNLMFAHQIPGELAGAPRNRSAATPVWTGFLPFNGTVGVTRFGFFDPELALRYTKSNPESRGWGIFEWHPKPNADPKDAKLYQTASEHLRTYYRARCHHLFAGWWKTEKDKPSKDFPLVDSQFAKAIKDFMDSCPDQPYPGARR